VTPFDDLTDVYDALIDWPKRLAHETPFFQSHFARANAKTVADVACGTGRHAALFHAWGLTVHAADVSPAMIDRAVATHGRSDRLTWAVRSFDQPIPEPVDAVVCTGNSLALAPDVETARRAVGSMLGALRPGGVAIVHVLNVFSLPDGPMVWQRVKRAAIAGAEVTIHKGVHRCGPRAFVELVVTPADLKTRTESVPFTGFDAATLQSFATDAGAADTTLFGGYRGEPFDPARSPDLILVAVK
jgi:SAM-dependent methyltransferase